MAPRGEVSINRGDQVAVLSHSQPARTNRKPIVYKIVMSNRDGRAAIFMNWITARVGMQDRKVRALVIASTLGALVASTACQSSSTNVVGPGGEKCAITLPQNLPSIGAEGGTGTLQINVAAECVWSVSSGAEWIAITSNNSGQGSGVVNFAAASNPAASVRRGAVIVSDRRVELMQAAAACQFTLSPATASIGSNGDEGDITVTVAGGCQWSATSQTPWLSVVSGQSGTGAGSVRYRVDANSSAPRSGALTIGDRSFTVNQGGTSGCALALGRTERSVPASGGTDVVSVNGTGDCPWAAESRAAWITITSGARGNGPGTVSLNIAPNSGGPRSGVVIIAGYMYLVTQAATPNGNCSYSIDSAGQSLSSSGGSANIAVSASGGCSWSAVSHASWISIVGGGNGSGNGVVTFTAVPNPGPQRQGLVTVAGYTHTVTQQSAGPAGESPPPPPPPSPPECSFGISSPDQTVTAVGGPAAVGVTAGSNCSWSAVSDVPWVLVISGSGSGNGTVVLNVGVNTGGQRVGHVTIAGQVHTLTQAASPIPGPGPGPAPCSFGLGAADASVASGGGIVNVAVTSGTGCDWTAASQAPWISVTNGASGSGNGTRATIRGGQ